MDIHFIEMKYQRIIYKQTKQQQHEYQKEKKLRKKEKKRKRREEKKRYIKCNKLTFEISN